MAEDTPPPPSLALASAALLADLERRYVALREENASLHEQLRQSRSAETAAASAAPLPPTVDAGAPVPGPEETNAAAKEQQRWQQERHDRLLVEADALREEIRRLTADHAHAQSQLAQFQLEQSLSDAATTTTATQLATARLQTEWEQTQAHAAWLAAELDAAQRDVSHVRQETADRLRQMSLQLDQARTELQHAREQEQQHERQAREWQQQLQRLSQEQLELQCQLQQEQEAAALELAAARRQLELQEAHTQRWQARYDDVLQEQERLQRTAQQALQAGDAEVQAAVAQVEAKYVDVIQELKAAYEAKLVAARVEPQLTTPRHLLTADAHPERPTREEEEEEGPLNMTDLYEKWEATRAELRAEILQRKKWQLQFQRVQQDISAKAPEMMRQRQEYELAVAQLQDYQSRLTDVLQERDDARADRRDALQELQVAEARCQERTAEAQALAQQVQALLVSRSGGTPEGDIPTSVAEMQSQNQRLLLEHGRLTRQVAELEERLRTDYLRTTLAATEREMSALRQERKEQELLVGRIVQQRDLYRALLCKHDSAILGEATSPEEVTALTMAQQQSDRIKMYEQTNMELEATVKRLQSETDQAVREKEGIEERMVRLEAVQEEWNGNIHQLQKDLLSARSAAARSESEATYHKEKCERLEASVDRAREESMKIDRARSELQAINAELENSLSSLHADRTRVEGEKRHIEAKLRLSETQLATVRAAEGRLMEENRHLHTEIASQGALMESVRRIESSLSAKAESERTTLQQEVESLQQKLSVAESNFATRLENANSRILELEGIHQELQASDQKHQMETLAATKSMLESAAELQTLKASFKSLEAQLRSAKRKLGEGDTDNEEDMEMKLQSRIDSLEADLEAARSEIAALQESANTYKALAKTSESELSEIRQATDTYKADTEKELVELKQLLAGSQNENLSRQKIICDLTNDLAGQRGEREKLEAELQSQISLLQAEIQNNEKDVTSAKALAAVLQNDIVSLRTEASSAQKNYERELGLHAQARTALRVAHEAADEAVRLQVVAEKNLEVAQMEWNQLRESWEQEKFNLQEASKLTEKSLQESREQNKVLHSQLETLNDMVEKNQASRISAAATEDDGMDLDATSQKITTELREVVRFLRSENELLQTQLDTSRRSADREKSAATVLRRSLEDARSQLQELVKTQDTTPESTVAIAELEDKLRASESQLELLRDSNKLLREEVLKLKVSLQSTLDELVTEKNAAVPVEDIQRELGSKIAALQAEKISLESELESWKGRMTSLVSNFNQIDPEEHRLLQKKVEELNQAIESHKLWQKTTEEENTRIRNIAKNLKNQRSEMQQKVEAQKLEIEQLTADKASNAASAESAAQKGSEQLKLAISKMESEAKSAKTELDGANSRIERLRGKLHEFQTVIRDLRAKEQSLTEQLAVAQASTASATVVETPVEPMEEVVEPVVGSVVGKSDSAAPSVPLERMAKRDSIPGKNESTEDPSLDDIKIPEVPPEGFKFGPSKIVGSDKAEKVAPGKVVVASLRPEATPFLPSAATGKVAVRKEIEVPSSGTGASLPSVQQPSSESSITANKKVSEAKAVVSEPKPLTKVKAVMAEKVAPKEKAPDKKSVATEKVAPEEQAPDKKSVVAEKVVPKDKATKSEAVSAPEVPPRRLSGENKEQAIKEKILEKKRRLETLKALKQQASPETAPDAGESKPAFKKAKTETLAPTAAVEKPEAKAEPPVEADPPVALVAVRETTTEDEVAAVPEDTATETNAGSDDIVVEALAPIPESSALEEGMPEDDEEEPVMEEVVEKDDVIEVDPGDIVPIEEEEDSGGGMDESLDTSSSRPTQTASPFGAPMTTFASPFAAPFGPAAPAPIFGASASVLGSSTAAAPLTFGSFGSSSGPFLNMKPPSGNLADAPTFSFGRSSNITLTSPTIPTAPAGGSVPPPFGVFSGFGGGGFGVPSAQAQPLFGATLAGEEEEGMLQDEEEEEGAMEDSQE